MRVVIQWSCMSNTNKNNSSAGTEVAAIVPAELEHHDPKMSQAQLALAVLVARKNPQIVAEGLAFREAYNRAGERYFGMCNALRSAKLVKKEGTALLLGLGFSKSRASEVIRLSSVSDAIWAKYSAGSVGFKAALELDAPQEESSAGGTEAEGDAKKPAKAAVKIHDLPKEVHVAFTEACALIARPLKKGAKTEWAYACRTPDGVNFYLAITASPKQ